MTYKILIIDDQLLSRMVARTHFKSNGHIVFEAADCKTGYESALKNKPDLIVIDNMLPQEPLAALTEEALNLAAKIRETSGLEKVPLILMTNYKYDPRLEEFGKSHDNIAYFEKPFDNKEMYEKALSMMKGEG